MAKVTVDSEGFSKECDICGKPFKTQQLVQKRCSDQCVAEASRRRSREWSRNNKRR